MTHVYAGPGILPRTKPYSPRRRRHASARDGSWPAIEAELSEAHRVQQRLFPTAPELPGLDLGGVCRPAGAAGGDCFDYVPLPDGSLGLVIGDVSGHGLGAALLMTATRAYLRAAVRQESDPGQVLEAVNRYLLADVEEGRFVTLLFARLEPAMRTLTYASAGHPPGYVLNRDGAVRAVLQRTGCPLGVLADAPVRLAQPVVLEPGELVLFHTDGLTEAESVAGELFGLDRTLDSVRANRSLPARVIARGLYREARSFGRGRPQKDDITAIVLKSC
jgi:sigma-B regulation protein RsbU (phosphoserine phosphatase)